MREFTRVQVVLVLSVVLVLAAPLGAGAAWPVDNALEKYSVAIGSRAWSDALGYYGGGITSDASGTVYVSTDIGFDVYGPDGVRTHQFDVKGTGYGYVLTAAPNRTIYVVDNHNNRILRYSRAGKYLGVWGSKGTSKGHFMNPWAIAHDAKSNIYIADTTGRVQKFTSTGRYLLKFGGRGTAAGKFPRMPNGMAVDASGTVYTIEGAFEEGDPSPDRVQRFSSTGKYLGRWKVGGSDIAIDSGGNVFIAGATEQRIVQRYSTKGKLLQTYQGGSLAGDPAAGGSPWSIAVDGRGSIYVVCYGAG